MDYWVTLYQERPSLTLIILFVVLVVVVFLVRTLVIGIIDEITLFHDYYSDNEADMYGDLALEECEDDYDDI